MVDDGSDNPSAVPVINKLWPPINNDYSIYIPGNT
jgi:hypothetical protein